MLTKKTIGLSEGEIFIHRKSFLEKESPSEGKKRTFYEIINKDFLTYLLRATWPLPAGYLQPREIVFL